MSNDIIFTSAENADPEIPAWKALDEVCRKWATLSGFEKDQNFYEKLREISQKTRPKWQD
jgi:hypothetical protein